MIARLLLGPLILLAACGARVAAPERFPSGREAAAEELLFGKLDTCERDSECVSGVCHFGACPGLLIADEVWLEQRIAATVASLSCDAGFASIWRKRLDEFMKTPEMDPVYRGRAAFALGFMTDQESARILKALAQDADPAVRARAAMALASRGDRDALDGAVAASRHASAAVRAESARALGRIGGGAVVARLAELASDGDRAVRLSAVEALGDCREPGATAPLVAILEGDDATVRFPAAMALRRLTGKRLGLDAKAWREAL